MVEKSQSSSEEQENKKVESKPKEEEKETPLGEEQYRAQQSRADAAESDLTKVREDKVQLEKKLKSKMDDEEREKYDLSEEASRYKAERDELKTEVDQSRMSGVRRKLIEEKYPNLKLVPNIEESFRGKTEGELDTQMKEANDLLETYHKKRGGQGAEGEKKTSGGAISSSKAQMTPGGTMDRDAFSKLTLDEQKKYLEANYGLK